MPCLRRCWGNKTLNYKTMKNNLELYEKFRSVPNEAQKKITGGRLSGFTDINPMWRIKKLTEEFGSCGVGWYYEIVNQRIEQGGNEEKAAFVDILLFVKIGDEWSKGISGIGGSMFVSKEINGLYTSDECFKMALTDAISTACKALGIGADIYFEKDRTKYTESSKDAKPKEPEITFDIVGVEELLKTFTTYEEVNSYYKASDYKALPEFKKLCTDKLNQLKAQ